MATTTFDICALLRFIAIYLNKDISVSRACFQFQHRMKALSGAEWEWQTALPKRPLSSEMLWAERRLSVLMLVLKYGAGWAGFLALWLLFVSNVSLAELAAGAVGSAIALVALDRSLRADPLCFHPRAHWLLQTLRIPGMFLNGLAALFEVLMRRLQGKRWNAGFQLVRFPGGGSTPRDGARRAMAVLLLATPPNSLVIDIDMERNLVMFHQAKKTAVPEVLHELEA